MAENGGCSLLHGLRPTYVFPVRSRWANYRRKTSGKFCSTPGQKQQTGGSVNPRGKAAPRMSFLSDRHHSITLKDQQLTDRPCEGCGGIVGTVGAVGFAY